jgi:hypothetical protein
VLKFWVLIVVLACSGSAQAEDIGPWFGSEVASPEQVSVNIAAATSSVVNQNQNCTIYSCSKPENIVKPELKSASNP